MKLQWLIVLAAVCGGFGVYAWMGASSAKADGPQPSVAAVTLVTGATAADEIKKHDYVGSKTCKKCHMSQHKSWAKTKMSKALETLEPGEAVEAKKKHGLDPEKDYSTDKSCLPCHVVGFGAEGGYVVPDKEKLAGVLGPDAVEKALKKAIKDAADRAGVGCESCHGAGADYVPLFEEIMKSKRKYKPEELYDLGLTKMGPKACTQCHNDKSATWDKEKYTIKDADGEEQTTGFDYEQAKEKDTHEHKPLKQRDDG